MNRRSQRLSGVVGRGLGVLAGVLGSHQIQGDHASQDGEPQVRGGAIRVVQRVTVVVAAEKCLDDTCSFPADLRDGLFAVCVDHGELAVDDISFHRELLPGRESDGELAGEEPHFPGDGRQHGTVTAHDLVGVPPEVPNVADVRQEAAVGIQYVEFTGSQENATDPALCATHHADTLSLGIEDVEPGGGIAAELLQN